MSLLAPHLAEIQAIGIDIVQPAQGALAHQGAHFDEGGMVLEKMPDHEHEAALLRLSDEPGTLPVAQGERLFHEDMLAGLKRLHDHSGVLFCRRRNRDGIDCRISQHLGPIPAFTWYFAENSAAIPGSGSITAAKAPSPAKLRTRLTPQ